ncbi:MAG TPA: histidine phosphatase family protein [Verrucomicrobiae bacterium]|nr:histidine phosphatase family protein [Verrucomicrobiae bacterium]
MPLPIDMILVRHGESEGNVVHGKDYRGEDRSDVPREHGERHTSDYRLTDKGIMQAKAAGEWIRKNIPGQFDKYVVSSYARARETAGYLDLPGAGWEIDPYLAERNSGDLMRISRAEIAVKHEENAAIRALNAFYWNPPNGESRLVAALRWDRVINSLAQRYSDGRVVIVAHGTIIETAMMRRLHWTVEDFLAWKEDNDPRHEVHNCQVLHFTRKDPKTGQINPSVRWWRTVCPWDLSKGEGEWQAIEKNLLSSKELLQQVEKFPRYIA